MLNKFGYTHSEWAQIPEDERDDMYMFFALNELIWQRQAKELQELYGGMFLAFPVDEQDPTSKYAVVSMHDDRAQVEFPITLYPGDAAGALVDLVRTKEATGTVIDYAQDVRFFAADCQINSPNVTMRRMKLSGQYHMLSQ